MERKISGDVEGGGDVAGAVRLDEDLDVVVEGDQET